MRTIVLSAVTAMALALSAAATNVEAAAPANPQYYVVTQPQYGGYYNYPSYSYYQPGYVYYPTTTYYYTPSYYTTPYYYTTPSYYTPYRTYYPGGVWYGPYGGRWGRWR